MGQVTVSLKLENLGELYNVRRGLLAQDQLHSVQIDDALVDTGATGFSAPRSVIDRLGLQPVRTLTVPTAAGPYVTTVFEAVRLTIGDRECVTDVIEIAGDCPVLVGQIPLEALDLVVDPNDRQLIGNPEHGGEHTVEMY